MPTEEFSAGGVVVRDQEVITIVPKRRDPHGDQPLALPKGHPDGDESAEAAAAREVREETGVQAELVEKLGEITYTYRQDGREVRKRVAFFLFRYRAGDLRAQPEEIEEVRWMPLSEAAQALSFAGEREMAVRALSRTMADR